LPQLATRQQAKAAKCPAQPAARALTASCEPLRHGILFYLQRQCVAQSDCSCKQVCAKPSVTVRLTISSMAVPFKAHRLLLFEAPLTRWSSTASEPFLTLTGDSSQSQYRLEGVSGDFSCYHHTEADDEDGGQLVQRPELSLGTLQRESARLTGGFSYLGFRRFRVWDLDKSQLKKASEAHRQLNNKIGALIVRLPIGHCYLKGETLKTRAQPNSVLAVTSKMV
jgi:hypothetical protein